MRVSRCGPSNTNLLQFFHERYHIKVVMDANTYWPPLHISWHYNLLIHIKNTCPSSVPLVKLFLCNYPLLVSHATHFLIIFHVTKSTYASSHLGKWTCLVHCSINLGKVTNRIYQTSLEVSAQANMQRLEDAQRRDTQTKYHVICSWWLSSGVVRKKAFLVFWCNYGIAKQWGDHLLIVTTLPKCVIDVGFRTC